MSAAPAPATVPALYSPEGRAAYSAWCEAFTAWDQAQYRLWRARTYGATAEERYAAWMAEKDASAALAPHRALVDAMMDAELGAA
jgi:hypothetical protein